MIAAKVKDSLQVGVWGSQWQTLGEGKQKSKCNKELRAGYMWVRERQRQLAGNGGKCKNRWTGKNMRCKVEEKSCGMKPQKLKEYRQKIAN